MHSLIKIKLSARVFNSESLTASTNVNKNFAGGGLILYLLAHIVIKWVMRYHTVQEMKNF
jgi:hypothetical protein